MQHAMFTSFADELVKIAGMERFIDTMAALPRGKRIAQLTQMVDRSAGRVNKVVDRELAGNFANVMKQGRTPQMQSALSAAAKRGGKYKEIAAKLKDRGVDYGDAFAGIA
jgi:hypothetical protein